MSNLTFPSNFNPGRRRWLQHSGVAAGALILQSSRIFASGGDEISRTAEAIHQEAAFNARPERIYSALTDAAIFQKVEAFSDAAHSLDIAAHPARISRDPGGPFSLFGDYVTGRHVELIANQRIIQAWRSASWGPGIYSIARFELAPAGSGTKLIFDHTGFPAGEAEHLAQGWYANYWEPLRKFLA